MNELIAGTLFTIVVMATVVVTAVWLERRLRKESNRRFGEIRGDVGMWSSALEHRLRRVVPLVASPIRNWVVIASRDRCAMLARAIDSAITAEPSVRIVVIDTGSTDGTATMLEDRIRAGVVDRVVRHRPQSVPQWQKGYAIAEAVMLLQLDEVRTITVIDDDMEIQGPWLEDASRLLFASAGAVPVVNLHDDSVQTAVHANRTTATIAGIDVPTSTTFNGAAFVVSSATLVRWGIPPVAEGVSDASVEDWYYSRCATREGARIAILPRAVHHGYGASLRESL